jgi:hypothetical protein
MATDRKQFNLTAQKWSELIAVVDLAFQEAKINQGCKPPDECEAYLAVLNEYHMVAINKINRLRTHSRAAGIEAISLARILDQADQIVEEVVDRHWEDIEIPD